MPDKVSIDNPFFKGFIVRFDNRNPLLKREKINYQEGDEDELHTVRKDERLDTIAYDYYGESRYWWIIADANNIFMPLEIKAGTNIIIPDLERVKALYL